MIEYGLQTALHRDVAIGPADHAFDEIRPWQVQAFLGHGPAAMLQQIFRLST
jgi:hypothetical protein